MKRLKELKAKLDAAEQAVNDFDAKRDNSQDVVLKEENISTNTVVKHIRKSFTDEENEQRYKLRLKRKEASIAFWAALREHENGQEIYDEGFKANLDLTCPYLPDTIESCIWWIGYNNSLDFKNK